MNNQLKINEKRPWKNIRKITPRYATWLQKLPFGTHLLGCFPGWGVFFFDHFADPFLDTSLGWFCPPPGRPLAPFGRPLGSISDVLVPFGSCLAPFWHSLAAECEQNEHHRPPKTESIKKRRSQKPKLFKNAVHGEQNDRKHAHRN